MIGNTSGSHTPVDFQQLMPEDSLCPSYPALQPFFNYLITSHTEGPKKWYLASCSDDPVKVYLPVKALLGERGIRVSYDEVTGGSEGATTVYDGILNPGFSDCLRKFYPKPVQTYCHNVGNYPWELDHMFATEYLYKQLVNIEVLDDPIIHKLSDHNPIVADFKI